MKPKALRGTDIQVVMGDEVARRQLSQWQCKVQFGVPPYWNSIAPHRHLPPTLPVLTALCSQSPGGRRVPFKMVAVNGLSSPGWFGAMGFASRVAHCPSLLTRAATNSLWRSRQTTDQLTPTFAATTSNRGRSTTEPRDLLRKRLMLPGRSSLSHCGTLWQAHRCFFLQRWLRGVLQRACRRQHARGCYPRIIPYCCW
jgi:hypothetical protein